MVRLGNGAIADLLPESVDAVGLYLARTALLCLQCLQSLIALLAVVVLNIRICHG